MTIKVILLRKVPVEKEAELRPLLVKLRALCMEENPGYVGGETLLNADDPTEVLVISTWSDIHAWNKWVSSEKRAELQNQVDELLGTETQYQVYYHA